MEKRVNFKLIFSCFALVFILVFLCFYVSASGADSEIAKITNYAEEYESGNINYVQLMVYLSNSREKMNKIMGATDKEQGGIVREEQLRAILGNPIEKTKWAWNEKEMREVRQENDVPVWKKIVFDGNKIQILLNAWPSMFEKGGKDELVYRLDIRTSFKKIGAKLDMNQEIDEVKKLAEEYNSDPSNENANELAKKSVAVEMSFEQTIRDGMENCDGTLSKIFGSENKMSKQKTIVNEIDFYEGDNFNVIMRLEMCDDCEWHWINLDFWIDSRGMFEHPKEIKSQKITINPETMTDEDFKREIKSIFDDLKRLFESGDYNSAYSLKSKLSQYNEAWNQKSNDVWKQVDKIFGDDKNNQNFVKTEKTEEGDNNKKNGDNNQNIETSPDSSNFINSNVVASSDSPVSSSETSPDFSNSPERQDPYYWVKREQEKRKMMSEIAEKNYEIRKQFYLDLVSSYDKSEYIFDQTEFEKRLVEVFGEFKQEICNNKQDDNGNGNIDCSDEQCNGKICGEGEIEIQTGNETQKQTGKLYCIMKECQAREEIKTINESICGNHICETGEMESCKDDCSQCPAYPAINCSGKVIFKGTDENNCPLEPICLEEDLTCSVTADCFQPLCGKAECIEGTCEVSSLGECKEAECNEGQEKVMKCSENELISEKCFDGIWKETGVNCGGEVVENLTVEIKEEDKTGNDCSVKEDCGNLDDVCSNGDCVTLPKQEEQIEPEIKEERVEKQEKELGDGGQGTGEQGGNEISVSDIEKEVESGEESGGIVGEVIKSIGDFGKKISGFIITAFAGEEGSEGGDSSSGDSGGGSSDSGSSGGGDSGGESGGEGSPGAPGGDQREGGGEGDRYDDGGERRDDGGERRDDGGERRDDGGERDRYDDDRERNERRDDERRNEDDKRRNEECENNCGDNCERSLIVPCVQKCVFDSKCNSECENEMENCKTECKKEKDTSECKNSCIDGCKKGEGFEMEQDSEMNKFEKAVFKAGGQCRVSAEKKEGGIYFDGWGEPFEGLRYLKQEYYSGGSDDWCKNELDDYLRQRKEFEKSMNEEFLVWFFEKYVANSAEDWEEHISGIFELYWKDVDLSREIARTLKCSKTNDAPEFNLINIKYETGYGKVEFWEELKTIKMPEFGNQEMTVISPYMRAWVFPSKDFIKYEMKKAMKEHEFPGKDEEKTERKNQEGPTEEEKEQIKQDSGMINLIRQMTEKYGGNVDIAVQFKDYNTSEVVFNLYAQINENDIIKMKPMPVEEMPEFDIKIEIDFEKIYELIYDSEKEMQGERTESPPWDRKFSPMGKVKEITNGVKMYFKVRSILSSAIITPAESEKDARTLLKKFTSMMMSSGDGREKPKDIGEKLEEAKSSESA